MNTRIAYSILAGLRVALLLLFFSATCLPSVAPVHAQTAALSVAQSAARVSVVIELDAPSAAEVYVSALADLAMTTQAAATDEALAAQLAAATQAQIATNQAAQEALLAPLAELNAQVIYRVQRVYNGVAVRIASEQIDDLLALPGVAAVHPLIAKQPTNAVSVPFIGAPALWQGLGGAGVTGAGVRLAVIDTGVDYLHTAFGGPGTGYKENDVTKIGDIAYFPSHKIVGGYDFSGDNYNADPEDSDYQPVGHPDPDPMDCYGHGTHVAATAAGFGVTTDGKTYPGPYAPNLSANQFIIGPGVAPQADIYALKVFGCTGSSEIVDLAIEWAVDPNGDGDFRDRVDVINMSLGSTYGGIYDATSVAADRAAQVGIIVVASAGNSGDSYYAVGSPGTADRAISVAATRLAAANAVAPDASLVDTVAGFSSRGPRRMGSLVKPDLAAPGYQITSAKAGSGNSASTLNGTSMAAPHVAGAMSLLHQIHPTWSPQELKALVMNTAMPAVRSDAAYTDPFLAPGRIGAGRIDLPAAAAANTVFFNADEPGAIGVSFGAPQVVDIAAGARNVRLMNKASAPMSYTLTYSPRTDIPGVEFTLPTNNAISLPAGGVTTFNVGMNAVASQMQHTRDPAVPDVQGFPRHWISEESGLLMLWPNPAAFSAHLTGPGMTPPTGSQASGDIGFTYDPNTRQLSFTLSVTGLAAEAITGAALLRGLPGLPASAVAYPLYQGGGALAPGAPVQGAVAISAHDETLLAAGYLHAAIFTAAFPGGEVRGQVTPAEPVLKLPIYAAPRPASVMAAANSPLDFGATSQATRDLELAGLGLSGASYPLDYLSLVSALELHVRSPNDPPLGVLRPEPDIYDHADIKFVGIANDLRTTGLVNQSMLSFGLVTHADWASPREVELSVYMDIDEDGVFDYRLFNSDQSGFNNRFRTSDAFITAVENLHTKQRTSQEFLNGLSAQNYNSAPFNSNVMLLPVRAAMIGLAGGNTDFDYYVESRSSETIGVVDRTPTRHYNLAEVGLDTSGGRLGAPVYDDVDGATIPVKFDLANLEAAGGDALLLLHHHNAAGQRAEVVPVRYAPPGLIYLPLIRR